MGKLAIISDLHVDINHLNDKELAMLRNFCLEQGITRLHFAGDIANKVDRALAVVDFFDCAIPTTFHWGNHEMPDIQQENDFENFKDNRFLNFTTVDLSENTVLVGINGWYDYQFSDLKDEKEIKRLKNLFWYDRMIDRKGTDPEISTAICEKLQVFLASIPIQKQVILSTHFVPKPEFIVHQSGKYARWNHLNAFLGSPDFGRVIDRFSNVSDVVFGHTHRRFKKQKINGIYYHCQPFGYYYEWQLSREFVKENQLSEVLEPTKLRGVLRRHDKEFLHYRKVHLLEEVQKGMTILDY